MTEVKQIGQRVVVVNYYIGEFLESWNGQTGIIVKIDSVRTYIQIDGTPSWISALGFPHANLLALKGDLASHEVFVTPGKYCKEMRLNGHGRIALDEEDTLSTLQFIRDHLDAEGYHHDAAPMNQSHMHDLAHRGLVAIDHESGDGGRRIKLNM